MLHVGLALVSVGFYIVIGAEGLVQLAGSVGGARPCVSLRSKARLAVAREFTSSFRHRGEVSVGLAYHV
jgi:hypothetical protein